MQRHGGADVPRESVDFVAHGAAIRERRFHDQMFFAVHHRFRVVEIQEDHARVRHLGGDGLVAEIEANAVRAGLADHAREENGSGQEMKVRQLPSVARVPEHAGAGAALDILSARVHPKRRRAASHDARDGQIFAQQFATQNFHRRVSRFARGGALGDIRLMKMPVVGVEAARL